MLPFGKRVVDNQLKLYKCVTPFGFCSLNNKLINGSLQSIRTYSSHSNSKGIDKYPSLSHLNINLSYNNIHKLNEIKLNTIDLLFGKIEVYRLQQTESLESGVSNIINNILKDSLIYSMGFMVLSSQSGYRTLGEHILITKDINQKALITHLEGLLLIRQLEYWEESIEDIDISKPLDNVVFIEISYKAVSILHKDYKAISHLDNFNRRLKEINSSAKDDSIDMIVEDKHLSSDTINNNSLALLLKSITKFLKVIPFTCHLSEYGLLIHSDFKTNTGIIGQLYKYNHTIHILVYDKGVNHYKAIVYKNDSEYFRYEDVDILSNQFTRHIDNLKIYYKNNEIQYIDKRLRTKHLEVGKRDLLRDDKYLSFDIEAYSSNGSFIPYACSFYKQTGNNSHIYKHYSVINYKD